MAVSVPATNMDNFSSLPNGQNMIQFNDTAKKLEKNFLTCSVCFEVYTRPKSLPCLHTFCTHCLLSYIESQDMYGIRGKMGFPCPMCKQDVHIRNSHKPYKLWLDELPNNFLIQNMIDCLHLDPSDSPVTKNEVGDEDEEEKEEGEESLLVSTTQTPSPTAPPPELVVDIPSRPTSVSGETQYSYLTRMLSAQNALRQPGAFSHLQAAHASTAPGVNTGEITFHAPQIQRSSVTIRSLIISNPSMTYSYAINMHRTYDMTAKNWADYKPPILSDVCCLPKRNSIIVLDYDNRAVKYVKDFFLGRNVCTAWEVIGRPCCVTLLDKDHEDRIVVSLLDRNKLYFIRVPDLMLIDVMDTTRSYRGLTALSTNAILAASPGNPAQLDLIRIDHRCKMVSSQRILVHLFSPHYMTAVSDKSFVVSDRKRNTIVFYDLDHNTHGPIAARRIIVDPPGSQKFRSVGGIYYKDRCVYVVDTDKNEVVKVTMDGGVSCETVLTNREGIHKPASVCVGPLGEVVVVNWEGHASIYKRN